MVTIAPGERHLFGFARSNGNSALRRRDAHPL